MSSKLSEGEIGKGKILGVALGPNAKGEIQLEVEVGVDRRVLGDKEDSATEDITPFTVFTSLHCDEEGDNEGKRRAMARDQIRRLTGVELSDDFTETGYLRLQAEHEQSVVSLIVGKDVMVKCTGKYFNLYFPRALRAPMSIEQLKKLKAAKPY